MPSDLACKSSDDSLYLPEENMITGVERNTRKNIDTFEIKELDEDAIQILSDRRRSMVKLPKNIEITISLKF